MFRNALGSTPMTTPQANSHWKNRIFGDQYKGDVSFVSTLRMLFDKAVPEGEYLGFAITETLAPRNSLDALDNTLLISFYSNGQDVEEHVKTLLEKWPDFRRIQKFTDFYGPTMKMGVACIVSDERKTSVIFSPPLDMARYHYLQCSVPICLPWYFDPAKGISSESKALLKSLMNESDGDYLRILGEYVDGLDLMEEYREKSLREFESSFLVAQKSDTEAEIDNLKSEITRLMDQFTAVNRDITLKEAALIGIRQKISSSGDGGDLAGYFASNPNVVFESAEDGTLRFVCRGTLEYWEEDVANDYITRDSSFLYDGGGDIDRQDAQKLLTAVFIDRKIKLNVCARFALVSGGGVTAVSGSRFDSRFDDCVPNPHIQGYGCISGYVPTIEAYLTQHRYVEAIEQCVASCRSINFNDGTVMEDFMSWLRSPDDAGVNLKGFVLPDGTVTDPYGAIEYLKGE